MTTVTRLQALTLNMSLAAVAPAGSPLPWPRPLRKATTVAGLDPNSLDREQVVVHEMVMLPRPTQPAKSSRQPLGGALRCLATERGPRAGA